MFLIRRTSAPNNKKKSTALKLCVTVAVWLWNGVWPRKYFQSKKFFCFNPPSCTEPYGSWGKLQMEVIIPIPLDWGLWSEQGTCVQLFPHNLQVGCSRDNAAQRVSTDVTVLMSYVFLLLLA